MLTSRLIAGGSTTQVQYNSSGLLAGDAGMTFDASANVLTLAGVNSGLAADSVAFRVRNSSGATRSAGDLVYLVYSATYGMEALTTTTAQDQRDFAIVLVGGADTADIYVTRRGRCSVQYAGSAPAVGDYLVSSTTAGKGQLNSAPSYATSKFHPNLFGIALAAGSGGLVDCLLLTGRTYFDVANASDLVRVSSHSGTKFNGTISSASGTSVVYNAGFTGNEDSIVPVSSSELCALVLHNTTDNDFRLISSVNTGTNTITTTSSVPAGWAAAESIQVNSRINTDVIGASSNTFYDVEVKDTTVVPALTVTLWIAITVLDSGGSNSTLRHPYESGATGKRVGPGSSPAANASAVLIAQTPLVARRYQLECTATGSGTATVIHRIVGVTLATP